jgi:hypothetical protein
VAACCAALKMQYLGQYNRLAFSINCSTRTRPSSAHLKEAIDCLQRTRMDVLAIGPFLAVKRQEKEEKNETAHGSSAPKSRDL